MASGELEVKVKVTYATRILLTQEDGLMWVASIGVQSSVDGVKGFGSVGTVSATGDTPGAALHRLADALESGPGE